MNWFRKATITMGIDWDTAYKELTEELGRPPTSKEVRKKMHNNIAPMHDSDNPESFEFPDADMDYNNLPF